MTTWTDSAKTKLEGHLALMHQHLIAAGADPVEVTEDLRRHIDEEIAARRIGVVTTDDVEKILLRIGIPAPGIGAAAPGNGGEAIPPRDQGQPSERLGAAAMLEAAGMPPGGPKRRRSGHWSLLVFGVLLPAATLFIELITRMCAAAFFDPIPDIGHVVLVASVPVIHFVLWRALRQGGRAPGLWLGVLSSFSLVVAAYYSVLFVALMPAAVFAVLFFGWGLLPLSPILALIAGWRLRVRVGNRGYDGGQDGAPTTGVGRPGLGGFVYGVGLAALALALVVLPPTLTRHWARIVIDGTPAERVDALKWLRWLGHERTLLADCYGTTRWTDGNPFPLQGTPVPAEAARNVFYRVTGHAFNEFAPPQLHYGTRGWDALGDFSWDSDQGGTTVGGRLRGLSLGQSRLDGLVDGDAGWAYTEWILEFKNVASLEREARAQIALPPGGVVSRVTLWVNGEEREAAFAGSGEVRAAYEKVVKVFRRDPILVTHSGQDRVLMQCYPVPANGGTMKVRIGITAPLELENSTTAILRAPRFIERNFRVDETFEHTVWIESSQPLNGPAALSPDRGKPGVVALRGALKDSDLGHPASLIRVPRTSGASAAWVVDPHGSGGQFVRQTLAEQPSPRPGRVIVVIDGSKSMDELLPTIAATLKKLPDGVETSVLLAREEVELFSGPVRRADSAFLRDIAERLSRIRGVGGQGNAPALARAWDLAGERPGSVVLWIHGPQPVEIDQGEALRQRFEWRRPGQLEPGETAPVLIDFQVAPGLNRVADVAGLASALRALPRFGSVQQDLERLFDVWQGNLPRLGWKRERLGAEAMAESARGKKSSRHLARLWARDEVDRLIEARQRDQAVQTAAMYQLVTPVSGAVVLETKQQFEQAGLRPVASETVPTVPEPGALAILGVAMFLGIWWTRRSARRRVTAGSPA